MRETKVEVKEVGKPANEYLQLAKELGLTLQVEREVFKEWAKKGIPYPQIDFYKTMKELVKQTGAWEISYRSPSIKEYAERMPFSALIKLKEAQPYQFDDFQVWYLEKTEDPILVGCKKAGRGFVYFEIWRWDEKEGE